MNFVVEFTTLHSAQWNKMKYQERKQQQKSSKVNFSADLSVPPAFIHFFMGTRFTLVWKLSKISYALWTDTNKMKFCQFSFCSCHDPWAHLSDQIYSLLSLPVSISFHFHSFNLFFLNIIWMGRGSLIWYFYRYHKLLKFCMFGSDVHETKMRQFFSETHKKFFNVSNMQLWSTLNSR